LRTRAYDAAGNVGLSAVVTVVVANGAGLSGDGQAPVTSLGAPVSGAVVSGTVPVWASASDIPEAARNMRRHRPDRTQDVGGDRDKRREKDGDRDKRDPERPQHAWIVLQPVGCGSLG